MADPLLVTKKAIFLINTNYMGVLSAGDEEKQYTTLGQNDVAIFISI